MLATALRCRVPLVVKPNSAGLGIYYHPQDTSVLPRGSFICLYAGEYLDTVTARARWAAAAAAPPSPGTGNYILSLRLPDETIHIDPRTRGNTGRFLNHSCAANCVIHVVQWGADARSRAAIFVSRCTLL
jgi:histone-lysine N-methyltransferase SETMAR